MIETDKRRISRRDFFKWAMRSIGGGSLVALGGTVYATRIEPWRLKHERIDVPIANLPPAFDGYRVAQLSDLHLTDSVSRSIIEPAIQMALEIEPDLLVITGDYITGFLNQSDLYQVLRPLAAHHNIHVTLGNHDHWVDAGGVRQVLADIGLPELRNESTVITREGESIWLAGVDDIWTEHHDLNRALANIPNNAATILLAHEPDYADEVFPLGRVSLQLSGHSHGGQVRIPGFGAPILPYLAQKYPYGLRKLGEMWLYTNRGVGYLHEPLRLNCRPEIAEFRLRRV